MKQTGKLLAPRGAAGLEAQSLMAVQGKSESTTASYRGAVKRFVSWAAEGGAALGVDGLAAYVEFLRRPGVSASTLNLARSAIKVALLQAAERGGMAARELAVLKTAMQGIRGRRRRFRQSRWYRKRSACDSLRGCPRE